MPFKYLRFVIVDLARTNTHHPSESQLAESLKYAQLSIGTEEQPQAAESKSGCQYLTSNIRSLKSIRVKSRAAMQGLEDYVGDAVVGDSLYAVTESLHNSRDKDSISVWAFQACRYIIKDLVKVVGTYREVERLKSRGRTGGGR